MPNDGCDDGDAKGGDGDSGENGGGVDSGVDVDNSSLHNVKRVKCFVVSLV